MRRGCLWAIGIVLAIPVAGFIYLSLNPPFALPETGYLSSDLERAARLRPEAPVVVYQLRVVHDSAIFAGAYSMFEPTSLQLSAETDEGSAAVLEVRLYPQGEPMVVELQHDTDDRSVAWGVDCSESASRGCTREYLAVISAPGLTTETSVRLRVFAELLFPAHVPTPFMVSIGLSANQLDLHEAAALSLVEVDGSTSVSPGSPVVHHSLVADGGSEAGAAGTLFEVSAERVGESLPTGLEAPPPVRVALVDGDGQVLADLGPRPGSPLAVSLPPLTGAERLVVWWQDRADQAYQVRWRLESGQLGPGALSIDVGQATRPRMAEVALAEGEPLATVGSREPDLEFGLGMNVGEPAGPNHLAPAVGVLELRLEVDEDDADVPLLLVLSPDEYGADEAVPIPVVPGELVEVALEGLPGCSAYQCDSWLGLIREARPQADPWAVPVTVRWSARLRLWPLDPFGDLAQVEGAL